MEVVVPLFALSSLYLINNQNKKKEINFVFNENAGIENSTIVDENQKNVVHRMERRTKEWNWTGKVTC